MSKDIVDMVLEWKQKACPAKDTGRLSKAHVALSTIFHTLPLNYNMIPTECKINYCRFYVNVKKFICIIGGF